MAYLVYNKDGELEDVVNFNSLEEEEVYEKTHPDCDLEFIDDEEEFEIIDEDDNQLDEYVSDDTEAEW